MMSNREGPRKVDFVIIVVILTCIVGPLRVSCQDKGGGGGGGGAGIQIFAQELYRTSMTNITKILKATIKKELGFCIVDV